VSEYRTLITPAELRGHVGDADVAIVDCRLSPAGVSAGKGKYLAAHIPGAVHAHMERDLSGPIVPGRTGRHPLPDVAAFAETLSRWGIDDRVQVVVYDDSNGSNAARLWWMLRWLGHSRVAVLEGGWAAWQQSAGPVKSGDEVRPPRRFTSRPRPDRIVDASMVEKLRTDPRWRLIDTRAADRFRGLNEKVDPVAGHIPGAVSAPWSENLDAQGRFRPPAELARYFGAVVGDVPMDHVVCYCGSGVTAAHDILAMLHAGLAEPKLYPGSWSEWITDPERPIAT
jgi:thiosulfate/3-mercaptopyruvate sulfurtransferase